MHETTYALKARRARELANIHNAVCRWKRQGVACSTCADLNETAERWEARAAGVSAAVAEAV